MTTMPSAEDSPVNSTARSVEVRTGFTRPSQYKILLYHEDQDESEDDKPLLTEEEADELTDSLIYWRLTRGLSPNNEPSEITANFVRVAFDVPAGLERDFSAGPDYGIVPAMIVAAVEFGPVGGLVVTGAGIPPRIRRPAIGGRVAHRQNM
jgi:hypothetical protein